MPLRFTPFWLHRHAPVPFELTCTFSKNLRPHEPEQAQKQTRGKGEDRKKMRYISMRKKIKLSFVEYEDATDHCGFSNGSRTSPLREQIAIRIACDSRPRYSPRSVKYSTTASRASNRSSEANSPQRSDL